MRYLFLILLCPTLAFAQGVVPAGTALPRVGFDGKLIGNVIGAYSLGPLTLLQTDFGATGAEAGWATNVASTDVNWDSATYISEPHGLSIYGNTAATLLTNVFAQSYDSLYIYCAVKRDGTSGIGGTARSAINCYNGTASQFYFDMSQTAFRVVNGTGIASVTGSYSATNWYHIWIGYTKGTGSNGVSTLTVSATNLKDDGSTTTITNGTGTLGINAIRLGNPVTQNSYWRYDDLVVSTQPIGDNPWSR